MASKSSAFSRQETQCDHCGQKMNRHNLNAHTKNLHPNLKFKERVIKMKTLDSLFPVAKKPRLEDDNIDNELEVVHEWEDVKEPSDNNEVLDKLEELQSNVMKSLNEIQQNISEIKKEDTSKTVPQSDADTYQNNALENARTISEIIAACPEFEHVLEHKCLRCQLCVDVGIFNVNQIIAKQTIGVVKYSEENTMYRERDTLMDRDFRNVKIAVKKHLNSHLHKDHVLKIEQESKAIKNRDNVRNAKAAALRCARICYGLYQRGRPFSDYPETVATIVAGGTFMGEINHSTVCVCVCGCLIVHLSGWMAGP